MNEIARLVFPTEAFINNTELFVNKEEKECGFGGKLAKVNVYKFNTWMNMFAAKKYYFYCDLGDIYLELKVRGKYKVIVTGSNRNAAFERLDEILAEADCDGDCCIKVPNAQNFEGVYFTLIEDKLAPVEFYGGAWVTDKEPQRENKLAIVSCTFKRENYINKNIKLFEDFISLNPDLKDYIKLIVADNGKTLDTTRSNDMVKIIPNMNAGGAGGFTRGLMDVLENYPDFTRVLFMDDDVEIFPESFYRTLTLSNYLKEEYKDAFINGAMMNLYERSNFFENLALQKDLWVEAYYKEQKLSYNDILKINNLPVELFNNKERKADTAWWFHCFDLSIAREKGLPVPVFFRGDDVEWSWRNFGKHHISINGICVWHAPFLWRVSKSAEYYYLPRNMFFLNSLFTGNFKDKYKKYFVERCKYLLKTYDYVSLDILCRSMKDILKGGAVFKENPETQFKEINKIAKDVEYFKASDGELEVAKHCEARSKKMEKYCILAYR